MAISELPFVIAMLLKIVDLPTPLSQRIINQSTPLLFVRSISMRLKYRILSIITFLIFTFANVNCKISILLQFSL